MTNAADSMVRADAARERRWGRAQAASGLAFGVFAAVHLVNQWLAPLGPETYDGFQTAARAVYQQPVVEIGLAPLRPALPIADPTRNPYARMWEGYGVSLE